MINEQLENSLGFDIRVDYVCAALEKDIGKRPFVGFLGGNIVAGDPFIRTRQVIEVNTSELIAELDAHAGKYKGPAKDLCAHFVLSLATGENLPRKDLLECARYYMKSMGYGNGSKWFATVHYDTDNTHVHIVACRAHMKHSEVSPEGRPRPPQFSIVKDSNSYQKGWEACRELEKKFNLQVVANPDECFAKNGDLFRKSTDQEKVLRGIIGDVWKEGAPKTFSDLVSRLNKRGVLVKIAMEGTNPNLIKGIYYQLDRPDGRPMSGTDVKGTKYTLPALIRHGVNYNPGRDNLILGISPGAYTLVNNPAPKAPSYSHAGSKDALTRVYVKIPTGNKRVTSYVKNRGRTFGIYANTSSYLGFNVRYSLNLRKKTKAEVEAEIETERVIRMMNALIKLMKNALRDFFEDLEVQFEDLSSDSDLTETALRLNVPVTVDEQDGFTQHCEMEDAIEDQMGKQISYIRGILKNEHEHVLER